MDVIVLNHKNKVSLQVQHVDIGSSIDLHFPNENQSFDAFQKLREIGYENIKIIQSRIH